MKSICVFAASSEKVDKEYIRLAYDLGAAISKAGYGMVFGGGMIGLMGGCARGVSDAGGYITGVIPEKLNRPGIAFEKCTELIQTRTMHERKAKMEELSSAFVVLPGGLGTLEELMEVLTLKQLGYHDRPIVLMNHCGFFDDLIAQIETCIRESFTDAAWRSLYYVAQTAEQAIAYIDGYKPPDLPDKIEEALKYDGK